MPPTPPTPPASDPAAHTTPMPRVDPTPRLPGPTVAWLARHPYVLERREVRSVWAKLTELEQAGHHPDLLTALRGVLADHQPTPASLCRTCRRGTWRYRWRRRVFPCLVWHQIHLTLVGGFAHDGRHHQPAPTSGTDVPEQASTGTVPPSP
ncbi:MAG: hypothetical protein ACRDQ4_26615 [Pseudonocardiaceae bacterium]